MIGSGDFIIAASSLGSHPACILERLPEALARFVSCCFVSHRSYRHRQVAERGPPPAAILSFLTRNLSTRYGRSSHPLGASIFSPHANPPLRCDARGGHGRLRERLTARVGTNIAARRFPTGALKLLPSTVRDGGRPAPNPDSERDSRTWKRATVGLVPFHFSALPACGDYLRIGNSMFARHRAARARANSRSRS